MHIDGEAHRPGAAQRLPRLAMDEAQLFCPLANHGGSCELGLRCSSGHNLGEADADAPR